MSDDEDDIENDEEEKDPSAKDKKQAYRISGGILVLHGKDSSDLELTTDEKIPILYRFIGRKRFVCPSKLEVRAHRLPWCLCSCSYPHVDQWMGQF